MRGSTAPCDGRLRLHRQGHAAADPAPHRRGARADGDHRPRRFGARHRRIRRHPLREGAAAARHAARHPDAAADAGRLPGQPVGRRLVGRADRTVPRARRALSRHLHRTAAGRLHRSRQVDLRTLQLRDARIGAGAAPARLRSNRGGRAWRQSRHGQPPGEARIAASGARSRPRRRARHARGLGQAGARSRREGHPHRRTRHAARAHPQAEGRIRQHLVDRRLPVGRAAAVGARLGHAREAHAAGGRAPRVRLRCGDLSQRVPAPARGCEAGRRSPARSRAI